MSLQKQGLVFPNLPEITITRNEKTLDVTKKELKNKKNKQDLERSNYKRVLGLKESSGYLSKNFKMPIDDSIKLSSIAKSLLENKMPKTGDGSSNQQFLVPRRIKIKSGEFKELILYIFCYYFNTEPTR